MRARVVARISQALHAKTSEAVHEAHDLFCLLSLSLGMAALAGSAQFGTAPDFNVTDLDGNTHQLYADILDQGLIAVIDVSATWCGPCWSYHESGVLEDLYDTYGPDGTNELRVFFIEGDDGTTQADLEGTGPSTAGD